MGNLAGLIAAAPSTRILTDGYDLQADNKGFYGTIRFWLSGDDLQPFSVYVAGAPQTLTIATSSTGVGTSITRLIPLKHPYIANCYCDDIRIYPPPDAVAGLDGDGGGISFTDYFADVHFSTPIYNYESGPTPCTSISLDAGSEMVTRPATVYKMLSDGLKVNHDVGVPVQTVNFTLTSLRMPSLDIALYCSLAGCVNATEFFNQDPGTVLYEGPGVTGQYFIGGYPSFDVAHRFKFRSVPHNFIMRSDGTAGPYGTGFDMPVLEADGSTPMIPSGELNQLWGM